MLDETLTTLTMTRNELTLVQSRASPASLCPRRPRHFMKLEPYFMHCPVDSRRRCHCEALDVPFGDRLPGRRRLVVRRLTGPYCPGPVGRENMFGNCKRMSKRVSLDIEWVPTSYAIEHSVTRD